MKKLAADNGVKWQDAADDYQLESILQHKKILDAAYEDDQHMLQVIDFIINQCAGKLGLKKGRGNTYTAILTTSSIKQAQRYYQLFKDVKAGKVPSVTVHDDIKRQLSDFPKVAITYSVAENGEKDSFNQDQMKESMQDYNAMFGTQYTMEQLGAYNSNINDRLARKKKIYQVREAQLDLVIVVDRLLTGFDAPSLSTLFIDRKPMRSYGIIQAFSRTNRLYDNQKRFGQIVIFQVPAHFKKAVDDAMRLYSSGGGSYVQAPTWDVAEKRFKQAIRDLRQAAPTPDAVDTMSKAEKLRFLKAYRDFDDAYSDIQVYSPYQVKELPKDYLIDASTIEAYSGKFNNVKEEFRKDTGGDDPDVNLAINYELRCCHTDQIDEDYILRLMEATRADESALLIDTTGKNQKIIKEINDEITRFRKTNPARAEVLESIWNDYQDNPSHFINRNFVDVLNQRVDKRTRQIIDDFAAEWCVDPAALAFFIETYDISKDPDEKQENQDALRKHADIKAYRKTHPNIGLKYWRLFLQAIRELYVQKLQKLLE